MSLRIHWISLSVSYLFYETGIKEGMQAPFYVMAACFVNSIDMKTILGSRIVIVPDKGECRQLNELPP